jgi:lipopolysaccharide export system protein LptA
MLFLSGNVRLNDGKMRLECNEIMYDRNLGSAYYTTGGVLNQQNNTLTSRVGAYNTNSKRFTFRDSVRLVNPKYKIATDTLQYGSESEIAYFYGPTTITSDGTIIYCEHGNFDTRREIANLTQNAEIKKKAQTIRGDSIYYQAKKGLGEIYGNAYVSDTVNKYVITGGYAEYGEQPEFALVTNKPLYALLIENDSLFITGDTLRITTDAEQHRKIRVYHRARFFKSDFQGKSDSLIYLEKDSVFMLYQDPVVWNENNQLTADFIYMTTRKGNLDSLHMINNAFMVAREDTTRYNQIKGRNMYGLFADNALRSIYVNGNGQTVYYAYDEAKKEIGINRADCSNLRILINDSKVERVVFITKPNATLYPPGKIPEGELFLKGFHPRFSEKFESKEELLTK